MQWKVKYTNDFERCVKGVSSRRILQKLDTNIARLRRNPYVGKRLRPPYAYLWEVYKGRRFRLYYEIHEKRRVVLLRGFGPRRLQKRFLRKTI